MEERDWDKLVWADLGSVIITEIPNVALNQVIIKLGEVDATDKEREKETQENTES